MTTSLSKVAVLRQWYLRVKTSSISIVVIVRKEQSIGGLILFNIAIVHDLDDILNATSCWRLIRWLKVVGQMVTRGRSCHAIPIA